MNGVREDLVMGETIILSSRTGERLTFIVLNNLSRRSLLMPKLNLTFGSLFKLARLLWRLDRDFGGGGRGVEFGGVDVGGCDVGDVAARVKVGHYGNCLGGCNRSRC